MLDPQKSCRWRPGCTNILFIKKPKPKKKQFLSGKAFSFFCQQGVVRKVKGGRAPHPAKGNMRSTDRRGKLPK